MTSHTARIDAIDVDGQRVRLGVLTVLTGPPAALRRVTGALGERAIHVPLGHDRDDAIAAAVRRGASFGLAITIDTFECGLHFTDLEPRLTAIFDDAAHHEVQVVVTTQSAEVVEALADLCRSRPDAELRLTKCWPGPPDAPSLERGAIEVAARQRIETR